MKTEFIINAGRYVFILIIFKNWYNRSIKRGKAPSKTMVCARNGLAANNPRREGFGITSIVHVSSVCLKFRFLSH